MRRNSAKGEKTSFADNSSFLEIALKNEMQYCIHIVTILLQYTLTYAYNIAAVFEQYTDKINAMCAQYCTKIPYVSIASVLN